MTYSLPDVNVAQSHNEPDAAPPIPTDIAPPEVTDTVLLSPGSLNTHLISLLTCSDTLWHSLFDQCHSGQRIYNDTSMQTANGRQYRLISEHKHKFILRHSGSNHSSYKCKFSLEPFHTYVRILVVIRLYTFPGKEEASGKILCRRG